MEEQWYNPFGGNQKRGREKKNSPRRRLITETYDLSHWENGPFQFFMTNLFDCATIKHIIMKPPKPETSTSSDVFFIAFKFAAFTFEMNKMLCLN